MAFWGEVLLHVLLPRACLRCGEDLPFGNEGPLCAREVLAPPPEPACVRCGGQPGGGRSLCRACSGRLFACRLVRAACAHQGAAAALVHAFKFRGFRCAARAAGRAMSRGLARRPELAGFDGLVAVPLHPRREQARGYNQAELLGREVAAEAGLPLLDLLERRRGAGPAWRIGRDARRRELAGAFAVKNGLGERARGRRLLLIDDVCASATTLEECARALRAAGAKDVGGYVFTRAGG
ncbi:MAG: ComF family protein [Elusimicrobia bacterium]|nr:ComF family protein [Elusimicrobiota bacterium]